MSAQPTSSSLARREALYTGLGFALGFGWLWFPALQGFWLPEFLWGGVFDGGGTSLFCALLLAGFFGAGLWGRGTRFLRGTRLFRFFAGNNAPADSNGDSGAGDLRASRLFHWAHAAAFALVAVSLLPPAPASGVRLYLPVIAMALAALFQGLFWGGAVLALPPRLAAVSFVVAAFTATAFCGLVSLVPSDSGPGRAVALLLAVLAAWAAAYALARSLRIPRPEPKRPRGRPAKNTEPETEEAPEASEGDAATGRLTLYAAGTAIALLALAAGFAERIYSPSAFFFSPWAAGLIAALGAALGFVFCGNGASADNGARDVSPAPAATGLGRIVDRPPVSLHPVPAVCLALALCGIALALPEPFAFPFAASVLGATEGFISVAAVIVLAQLPQSPLSPQSPPSLPSQPPQPPQPPLSRRAALALGAAFVLSNLGSAAAGFPALLSASSDMITISRAVAGLIAAVALLLFTAYRRQRNETEPPDPEPAREIPLMPAEPEATAVTFTAREGEILSLIRQGLNNREIAKALHVQEVTVRFHLRNLYQKAGLTEREQLAALDVAMKGETEGI